MFGEYTPHRHSLLLVDGRPPGNLVAPAGFEGAAVIKLQVGNPPADRFSGRASVDKAADADHITALLIIGIGIEEIVADIFEDTLDLAASHALDVGFRIGNGGLGQYVFHRHRLSRQDAYTPAEPRLPPHLGVSFPAQAVHDHLLHR